MSNKLITAAAIGAMAATALSNAFAQAESETLSQEQVLSELVEEGVISAESAAELENTSADLKNVELSKTQAESAGVKNHAQKDNEPNKESTETKNLNKKSASAPVAASVQTSSAAAFTDQSNTQDEADAKPTLKVVEQEQIVSPQIKTTDLLNLMIAEGLVSRDAAVKLVGALRARALRQAQEQAKSPESTVPEETVRVPYISEQVKQEIARQVTADLSRNVVAEAKEQGLASPEWAQNLVISGDMRVRYSGEYYPKDNPDQVIFNYDAINDSGTVEGAERDAFYTTTGERQQLLGRARLKLASQPSDNFEVGMRLTSGNNGSPVSSSQTLGRFGEKWEAYFDLAYIQYQSEHYRFLSGRFENPWVSTDLMWDRDMTFEGLFAEFTPLIFGGDQPYFSSFFSFGAFPIQELHVSKYTETEMDTPDDKWLYSFELGSDFNFGTDLNITLGLGYYKYENITGRANARGQDTLDETVSPYYQFGNSVFNIAVPEINEVGNEECYALASEFELLNFTVKIDYQGLDKHSIAFVADTVENKAFDRNEINARVQETAIDTGNTDYDVGPSNFGYQLETNFGSKGFGKKGDWRARFVYRYLEGDATLDAFADSNFLVGGTNAQGYIIRGEYFIADNVWLTATLISADEVGDYPIPRHRIYGDDLEERLTRDLREDTILLDLSARF